jgi:hypothetical protein
MVIVGDIVIMDHGHYKGREGTIRVIKGDKYTITLNDTPGPQDVKIRNVLRNQFHKKPGR